MPRNRVTDRGRKARDTIVDAAEAVFCGRGLFGASVRDIARAAGIPTASLLHHFATKQKLYSEVLDRIARDLDRVVTRALRPDPDPVSRLERLCRAVIDWCNADHARSNLLVRELLDNPERLPGSHRLPLAPVVERIAGFLRDGQARGAFRKADVVVFIGHVVGSASYFAAARPTLARITGRDAAALTRAHRREVVRHCVRAIAAEGAIS